jgi:PAS domain S-box-containing protein
MKGDQQLLSLEPNPGSKNMQLKFVSLLPVSLIVCILMALILENPPKSYLLIGPYFIFTCIFSVSIPLVISYLSARAYIKCGLPSILCLGCGMTLIGAGSSLSSFGPFVIADSFINYIATIYSITALLSAASFSISSAMLMTGGSMPNCHHMNRKFIICIAYASSAILILLVACAAYLNILPDFFILGQGNTPLQRLILQTAVILLAITSTMLMFVYWSTKNPFPYWYSLATFLLLVGIVGRIFQTIFGSALNWASRGAEYMSAVYILIAVIVMHREAKRGNIDIEDVLNKIFTAESARKQAEEDLKQAKDTAELQAQELDSTLNAIADGLIVLDIAGRIVRTNEIAEKVYSYSKKEMSLPIQERLKAVRFENTKGETVPGEGLPGSRALKGETVRNAVYRLIRPGGTHSYWISMNAAPIRWTDGSSRGAVVTFQDITERELLKDELVKAKEISEAATRTKSEFLANMSHEIRTPMTGILGMTQLALKRCEDPKTKQFLLLAKQSGESLLSIINDILDLSKIEAGKIELVNTDFSLRDFLDLLLESFKLSTQEKEIELTHAVQSKVPDKLIGDSGRLRQILTNLLGNAVKFTKRGTVALSVKCADESVAYMGKTRILFTVQDTGIGIPANQLDSIFESFSQGHTSAHPEFGGTGLGLAISKSLVEMMEGNIRVESELGKGSTFSFTAVFRLPEQRALAEIMVHPAERPSRKIHILLAEDDWTNRILVVELLEEQGHQVDVAGNGHEVLEKLREGTYDLVLMDVRMPGMNGEEATKRIRAGGAGEDRKDIPVVALTAFAITGDKERFLAAGMDDYLSKPVDIEELNRVLARVIGQT